MRFKIGDYFCFTAGFFFPEGAKLDHYRVDNITSRSYICTQYSDDGQILGSGAICAISTVDINCVEYPYSLEKKIRMVLNEI